MPVRTAPGGRRKHFIGKPIGSGQSHHVTHKLITHSPLKHLAILSSLTFNKQERLKSRKLIEQLFSEGSSVKAYPIKALFKFAALANDVPLQATVSVSSRTFKKAVDRNRVKRLLREVYRLQKLPLQQKLQAQNKQLALFFIYTSKELPAYEQLQKAMTIIINRLLQLEVPV